MEYFELSQERAVENPIEVMNLDRNIYTYQMKEKEYEKLETLKVAYYSGREYEEVCDILTEPTFLISDKIKRLFSLYDKSISFKAIQVFSTAPENKRAPLYWVAKFEMIECLHESSKKYTNGTIEELVLERKKIGEKQIFRVMPLLEYKVIISLPVAESLLRRRFYGIGLKKVKVI